MNTSVGIGIGIAYGTRVTGGPRFSLPAPVLTWVSAADDNTPLFEGVFTGLLEGDVGRLQLSTDVGFTSPTEATNTADAAEVLALQLDYTSGALADGQWWARVRHERGASVSAWSNVETKTIATTVGPPTLTYIGANTVPTGSSPRTITAAGIGSAVATRLVIVAFTLMEADGSNNISAVTIGGVSATLHVQETSGSKCATVICSAVVPTGTTADIVITFASPGYSFLANTAFVFTTDTDDLVSTTPVTSSAAAASGTTLPVTVAVEAGGFVIAVGTITAGTLATMTGDQTLDTRTSGSSRNISGDADGLSADASFLTTLNWTSSGEGSVSAAAWR